MGNKFLLRRALRRSCSMIALAGFGMALAGAAAARAQNANAPVNLDLGAVLANGSGLPSFYTVSKTSVKTGTPATISAKRSMRGRSMYSVMFGIS